MSLILHGIKTCDTMKKARAWLDAGGVAYRFHDYRADGVPEAALRDWVARLGWEAVLNRAGTTFRALLEADKVGLDADKAIRLMLANPAMIKRPILTGPGLLLAGFKPDTYAAALG